MSAHVTHALAEPATEFTLLIDGECVTTSSRLDVINPATGRVFARGRAASRGELDRAVDAARRAFGDWRDTSYDARASRIGAFCELLRANQESLARLLTTEQGKPLAQARDEIARAASQAE